MSLKSKIIIVISDSYDPYQNLAIENDLLLSLGPKEKILFFYINRPSVVLGRFQNPWVECDLEKLKSADVALVRRQSGGGCVYHDEGNLNWSFIDSQRELAKADHNIILMRALASFGIQAITSERTDILVNVEEKTYKISGSAFKQKRDRSFHHGTFLVNCDLSVLGPILKVKNENIFSKATASNPNSVVNLQKLNANISTQALIEAISFQFENYYQLQAEVIKVNTFKNKREIIEYAANLQEFDWLYAQTPKFTYEFSENGYEFSLEIVKGIFQEITITGGDIHPSALNLAAQKLLGKQFRHGVAKTALLPLCSHEIYGREFEQIQKILLQQISI